MPWTRAGFNRSRTLRGRVLRDEPRTRLGTPVKPGRHLVPCAIARVMREEEQLRRSREPGEHVLRRSGIRRGAREEDPLNVLPERMNDEGGPSMLEPHEEFDLHDHVKGSVNDGSAGGRQGQIVVPEERGRQRQDPEIVGREQALDPATEFQVVQDREFVALTRRV